MAAAAAVATTPLAAVSASAGGNLTVTIPVATLSVTVSPSALASPSTCFIGPTATPVLNFPNGICHYPGITVTNTGTAATAHIDVQGADAVPSDGGTHWTLTPGSPGRDQFTEITLNTTNPNNTSASNPLSTSPQCDGAFNPGNATDHCAAAPNQVANEEVLLGGPAASTDPSTSFTTTVTWTAVQ